jgi:adenosylmethionine-8-amino-7-oxononanoate aminotransferase
VSGGQSGGLMHGPTFMGNPLACSVALASLDLLERNDFHAQTARIESELRVGLAPAMDLDCVLDVRTLGAVGVIQLTGPADVAAIGAAALERGVWVRPFRDLVYTMPPYVSTTEDIAAITSALVGAVTDIHG